LELSDPGEQLLSSLSHDEFSDSLHKGNTAARWAAIAVLHAGSHLPACEQTVLTTIVFHKNVPLPTSERFPLMHWLPRNAWAAPGEQGAAGGPGNRHPVLHNVSTCVTRAVALRQHQDRTKKLK